MNSLVPSISVTYSNPASISAVASVTLLAVLHVHWSFSVRKSAFSMLMYIMVLLMFLCPRRVFTWMMSLVLWYSIVAFQCRNVWNVILSILWFWSFFAVVCRCAEKFVLSWSMCVPKIVSLFCGIWFIMSMSLVLMGSIRGLLPLVGVMLRVFCSVDRSIQ